MSLKSIKSLVSAQEKKLGVTKEVQVLLLFQSFNQMRELKLY